MALKKRQVRVGKVIIPSHWVCNFYRIAFGIALIGGIVLGFVHLVLSVLLFGIAALTIVAAGDLSPGNAIALIHTWNSGKK